MVYITPGPGLMTMFQKSLVVAKFPRFVCQCVARAMVEYASL